MECLRWLLEAMAFLRYGLFFTTLNWLEIELIRGEKRAKFRFFCLVCFGVALVFGNMLA